MKTNLRKTDYGMDEKIGSKLIGELNFYELIYCLVGSSPWSVAVTLAMQGNLSIFLQIQS